MENPIPEWVRAEFPKIEHFYRALPIRDGQEQHVERMMFMIVAYANIEGFAPESRSWKYVSPSTAHRELESLSRAARKFLEKYESLSGTAWSAIGGVWPDDWGVIPVATIPTLQKLAEAAEMAVGHVPQDFKPTTKPSDDNMTMRVRILAGQYRRLTGKLPTRRFDPYAEDPNRDLGDFHSFVDGVLRGLGFNVSAEHYIRRARKFVMEESP